MKRKSVSKKCRGKAFELMMNVAALIFFLSLSHTKSLSLYACVCLYVCVGLFFFFPETFSLSAYPGGLVRRKHLKYVHGHVVEDYRY